MCVHYISSSSAKVQQFFISATKTLKKMGERRKDRTFVLIPVNDSLFRVYAVVERQTDVTLLSINSNTKNETENNETNTNNPPARRHDGGHLRTERNQNRHVFDGGAGHYQAYPEGRVEFGHTTTGLPLRILERLRGGTSEGRTSVAQPLRGQ